MIKNSDGNWEQTFLEMPLGSISSLYKKVRKA